LFPSQAASKHKTLSQINLAVFLLAPRTARYMNDDGIGLYFRQMKYKAVRKLVLSQVIFVFCLLVCVLVWPANAEEFHALSNYGATWPTVIPYATGFIAVAILMFLAAREFPKSTKVNRRLARIFVLLATLSLLVLVFPYSVNMLFLVLHMITGGLLFVAEVAVAFWLAFRVHRDRLNIVLFCMQIAGFVIMFCALDQVAILPRLYVVYGQLLALVAFNAVLTRAVLQIERVHLSEIGL
jgi:hypothetical protein